MITAAQLRGVLGSLDQWVSEGKISESAADEVRENFKQQLQEAIERETPPTSEQLIARLAAYHEYMRENGASMWCGEQDAADDARRNMEQQLHEAWEREQQGASICPCQSCRVDRWIAEEEGDNQ